MKKIILILLLVNMSVMLFGQHDYIKNDSNMVVVELLYNDDLTNSKYCQEIKYNVITKYTPYDLAMYGFKDGREYVSKELQVSDTVRRIFLERLVHGPITLYYLKGEDSESYYIEKEGSALISVPHSPGKDDPALTAFLQEVSASCPEVQRVARLTRYDRKYLVKFFKNLNECSAFSFAPFKFGVNIGYESARFYVTPSFDPAYVSSINFDNTHVFTAGAFIDYPFNLGCYSIHAEMMYRKYDFIYSGTTDLFGDIDFTGEIATLKMPVMLRYTLHSAGIRPFVNAGFALGFNVRNESAVYMSDKTQNAIEDGEIIETALIEKNLWGLAAGGGVEFQITEKNSVFLEFRYENMTELFRSNSLKYSDIILVAGFNF